jgi:hypothetical protein
VSGLFVQPGRAHAVRWVDKVHHHMNVVVGFVGVFHGQGFAKIDELISAINVVQLVDEHGHQAFDAARMIG